MFPKMYANIFAAAILFLSVFINPSIAAQTVNINNADAATIAENLNGIGEAKARAIVAYRAEHGIFVDEQDLIKVKGIGAKLLERNRSLISFGKKVSVSKPVVAKQAGKAKTDQASTSDASKSAPLPSTGTGTQPQLSN